MECLNLREGRCCTHVCCWIHDSPLACARADIATEGLQRLTWSSMTFQTSLQWSPVRQWDQLLREAQADTRLCRAPFSAPRIVLKTRGGAALLTCPAAPLRLRGLAVKRPRRKSVAGIHEALFVPWVCRAWSTDFSPVSTLKMLNKGHSSVLLYMPNGQHSSSRVVL